MSGPARTVAMGLLDRLFTTHVPETLVGLDSHLRILTQRLLEAVTGESSSTILVSGLEGTGKTHLVQRALCQLRSTTPDGVDYRLVHLDASLLSPSQCCAEITRQLQNLEPSRGSTQGDPFQAAFLRLRQASGRIILVVEAVDAFLHEKNFLYSLFEACNEFHGPEKTLCTILTARNARFPFLLAPTLRARFFYEQLNTMEAWAEFGDATDAPGTAFVRAFFESRLKVEESGARTSEAAAIARWNSKVSRVLGGRKAKEALKLLGDVTRDCRTYLAALRQLCFQCFGDERRGESLTETGVHEAVHTVLCLGVDVYAQGVCNLSLEAQYLLASVLAYRGEEEAFDIDEVLERCVESNELRAGRDLLALMRASLFELIDARLIAPSPQRSRAYRLLIPEAAQKSTALLEQFPAPVRPLLRFGPGFGP
ncbi:Orc4 [Giardia muris]|uniref:Orc4 n=1 Tax=Giardia muris TaxID=5742 RepID=A0A4Z1SPX2_GIAMU|nr:Orc4 [Giardia muris]|eukprot:TNJ27710.1 Orc4 [Giardia muris]